MILVDTSVWIDHLHKRDPELIELLEISAVLVHPAVIGELAVGSLKDRAQVLTAIGGLPASAVGTPVEVLQFVESRRLYGRGLGLIDAQLLVAAFLTAGTRLWTRDNRLQLAAVDLGVSYSASSG